MMKLVSSSKIFSKPKPNDLIFDPGKKSAYFAFPITSATVDQIEEAQNFSAGLEDRYVVLNPLTIYDNKLAEIWKDAKDENKLSEFLELEVEYKKEVKGNIDYAATKLVPR